MKSLEYIKRCNYSLAFITESLDDIIAGKPIHWRKVIDPLYKERWLADPFILDATSTEISVMAEEVRYDTQKGRIVLLTIRRETMDIRDWAVLLEEKWHLSFPNYFRKDGRVFVYPESAGSGKLYLYELVYVDGKPKLKKCETLCDSVIWDTDINDLCGDDLMFTSSKDDYSLDIFEKEQKSGLFVYRQSVQSEQQNMRLAGAMFKYRDKVYCPFQVSTPCRYGVAVEIKEVHPEKDIWIFKHVRTINHPQGWKSDGLHTFNTYQGLSVIDLHATNTYMGALIRDLVTWRKTIKQKVNSLKKSVSK